MNFPKSFYCLVTLALGLPAWAQETPPWPLLRAAADTEPLPGTAKLTQEGDLSLFLVESNDRFLDARLAAVAKSRAARGKSDDPANRERLASLLGTHRDARPEPGRFEYVSATGSPIATGEGLTIHAVRWTAFGDVHGEGLLIEPDNAVADVIALPDAGQSPEQISGLAPGEQDTTDYALRLARAGCRVLVPALIGREENRFGMTQREWLHRPAFELGRHLLGYELHKILAGIDCLLATQGSQPRKVGVAGWGEGGLLTMYAAALDLRVDAGCVSGYFGPREWLWMEPAEHNIFGLLEWFGDAEIAALVTPRPLVIESGVYPDFSYRCGPDARPEILTSVRAPKPGKPGRFLPPTEQQVAGEMDRLRSLTGTQGKIRATVANKAISDESVGAFLDALGVAGRDQLARPRTGLTIHPDPEGHDRLAIRAAAQVAEIERHNQFALIEAAADRDAYFKDLKTDNLDAFSLSIEPYREKFRTEVIGDFGLERIEPKPRSRKYQEGPKTVSYEVVLDVFDGVIAYGILTLPKDLDLEKGGKRPVVVCQHGLEGTPQDVVGEAAFKSYAAFATRLAERGYITFAPQNGYKYFDLFRLQQFKAQSMGKTLFSTIVPQHQQIVDWLAALPFVDDEKIAFYGLSYGGKSAMRIPPLVDRYCLSICSADFNEWVWKNAATDQKSLRYSYANKGEYEIFEWNLGSTFNYAEMAALICPRPFMVERGHFDGVGSDESVAYEFAKVKNLYQAKLGIGERCEIEWFVGPHTINGVGTYEFLDRHLRGK
jgi:dienelactone hydrolase